MLLSNNNFSNNIRKIGAGLLLKASDDSHIRNGARVVATAGISPISNISQILNSNMHNNARVASFEANHWRLDGTAVLPIPTSQTDMNIGGVSSTLSDINGNFSNILRLQFRIELARAQRIDDITLIGDTINGVFFRTVEIALFNNINNVIHQRIVTNTTSNPSLPISLGFNSVRFINVFINTISHPTRRSVLQQILFTKAMYIGPEQIKELNLIKETDIEGNRAASNSLSFSMFNTARNSDEVSRFLERKPLVECWYGLGHNSLARHFDWGYLAGKFRVNNFKLQGNLFKVDCYGVVSGLDNIFYDSNFSIMTLREVVERIMQGSGIVFKTPAIFNDFVHFAPFFGNIERRRALLMIARLTGTLLTENSDSEIEFIDPLLNTSTRANINLSNIMEHPRQDGLPPYNGLLIREDFGIRYLNRITFQSDFTVSNSMAINVDFEMPIMENGTIILTPGFTLQSTVLTATKLRATIRGTGVCNLTVRGNLFSATSSRRVFYPAPWRIAGEPEMGYELNFPFMVTNLLHYQNMVLPWILNRHFALLRRNFESLINWRQDPRLEIGDRITAQTQNGPINGIITHQEINLSEGELSGQTRIVDYQ